MTLASGEALEAIVSRAIAMPDALVTLKIILGTLFPIGLTDNGDEPC